MGLTVAQIDAAIATINSAGQSYQEGDFQFERARLADLLEARKIAVAEERIAANKVFQRVRFGTVGS